MTMRAEEHCSAMVQVACEEMKIFVVMVAQAIVLASLP